MRTGYKRDIERSPPISQKLTAPNSMLCPIGLGLMTDPVIAADGHVSIFCSVCSSIGSYSFPTIACVLSCWIPQSYERVTNPPLLYYTEGEQFVLGSGKYPALASRARHLSQNHACPCPSRPCSKSHTSQRHRRIQAACFSINSAFCCRCRRCDSSKRQADNLFRKVVATRLQKVSSNRPQTSQTPDSKTLGQPDHRKQIPAPGFEASPQGWRRS